jgi:CubicO group peptidase (beta-lactamase class C family)
MLIRGGHVKISSIVCLLSLVLPAFSAEVSSPLYDIPKLAGIQIDGQAADWGDQGFRVEMMKDENGQYLPAQDFDGAFRLGWNDEGLLLLVTVHDDQFVESPSEAELWKLDGLEIFVADRKGGLDMVQPCITPGLDPEHPELRWHIHDHRQSESVKSIPADITAHRIRTADGYILEALLPWKNLNLHPKLGDEIGFQIYINDADGLNKDLSLKWFPRGETHADTANMHRVRLSDKAGPAFLAVAEGSYDGQQNALVHVTGASSLIGKTVQVSTIDALIATGVLSEVKGRAHAEIGLPKLPPSEKYPLLTISIDERKISDVTLPDPAMLRAKLLIWKAFKAFPFAFKGTQLPEADFANRWEAESFIGPYQTHASYYDDQLQPVTSAEKAGRYGVVLEVRPEYGRSFKRFLTAFRFPSEMDFFRPWHYDPQASVALPEELALKPEVIGSHSNDLNQLIKDLLLRSFPEDGQTAALLAGLYDAQAHPDSALAKEEIPTVERQWWVNFKRQYYGLNQVFTNQVTNPHPTQEPPAPTVHEGTLAEAGVRSDDVERIEAVCRAWSADTDEAFAVCLVRHGVVFFHKAYGVRDGQPMTVDTPSWMASITKLMSGSLMTMLLDQGLVDLDDPVAKYLPAFKGVEAATPLTVRHLYSHTSGLWDHWGDDMNDLEERVAFCYPHLEIGQRFQYNGVGFSLGGKIIEMISGEAIPLFYQRHLLGPLGMIHTRVRGTSGDAVSTPLDMAHLGQMLLNRGAYGTMRFFSEDTFKKFLPDKLTKVLGPQATKRYGLGCDPQWEDLLGEGTFGHGAASSATFMISPQHDLVVVMCRNSAGRNFDKYHPEFVQAVANAVAEKPAKK